MTPVLKKLVFKRNKGIVQQEFIIKEKDFGDMVLYDVFFEETFLCSISHDGNLLLSNGECAKSEQVSFDTQLLDQLKAFVISRRFSRDK